MQTWSSSNFSSTSGARRLCTQSQYSVMSRFHRKAPVALYVYRCMWFSNTPCSCRPICGTGTVGSALSLLWQHQQLTQHLACL